MNLQAFKEMFARRPFQPVRLILSTGQSYEIRRREAAFLTRNDVVIGTEAGDDGIPAEFKVVSLSQVTAIGPIEATSGE